MERIRIYEQLRKGDPSKEPKDSYSIYGFAAGPIAVEPTKSTRFWCRWPYEDHPRGCTNCGKGIEGCPGGANSTFFSKQFFPEAYLIGVSGDFGEYLKSRQKQKNGEGIYGSKELKNKRWYQETMNSWRLRWSKMVLNEFSGIRQSGWNYYEENAEARGVNFGQIAVGADLKIVRIKPVVSDYKVITPTFSKSPELSFENLGNLPTPFLIENYFTPALSEIVSHFDNGGMVPMWRLALIAKELTS